MQPPVQVRREVAEKGGAEQQPDDSLPDYARLARQVGEDASAVGGHHDDDDRDEDPADVEAARAGADHRGRWYRCAEAGRRGQRQQRQYGRDCRGADVGQGQAMAGTGVHRVRTTFAAASMTSTGCAVHSRAAGTGELSTAPGSPTTRASLRMRQGSPPLVAWTSRWVPPCAGTAVRSVDACTASRSCSRSSVTLECPAALWRPAAGALMIPAARRCRSRPVDVGTSV